MNKKGLPYNSEMKLIPFDAIVKIKNKEEIAKEKYPDIPYWCDTGSRWNVCMAMLEQFKKDIKR